MSKSCYSLSAMAFAVYVAIFAVGEARADQLVYVPLTAPCRLVDTRASTGGPGPLSAGTAHLFGTQTSDITSTAQHGDPAGCNIPNGAEAISVNMNLLNATASGNIATWSPDLGGTAPNIGTAVYNPTVGSPASGQVEYNTGYSTIPLGIPGGTYPGKFYLKVANGQIDMTINVVGYWLPVSWAEDRSGQHAIALGYVTHSNGDYSTAMGNGTYATGTTSTAMGDATTASGPDSTAMGQNTVASGANSVAMGTFTTARGAYSTAMGYNVDTGRHPGAFIYGDSTAHDVITNDADNQFKALATGGVTFLTSNVAGIYFGAQLAPGSTSWTTTSDRNAKTAVQSVDPREILKKVVAMPMNTWQYKTQEAKYRHMGPMAQDFYSAFHLGESDKGIDTVDADGVALAAIQGLHAELMEKNHEMAARLKDKEAEIASLRAELTTRVAALESMAGDLAEVKARLRERDNTPASVTVALKQ